MIRARAVLCLVMVSTVLGACAPRARIAQTDSRAAISRRMSPAENRETSAPQTERVPAAEEYFNKDTGRDEDEFGGMKGGLPMLLFIGLIAAAVGAL